MDEEDYVTYKVSSQKDKIVFFANYTIHELELADAEQLSKTSLEAFNEAVEGEIVSSGDWKVGSSKGLQAVIEMSATKHKVNYRAILVGNIQYQLVVFSEAENWNQQLSNDFMQSFTLKN